MILKRDFDNNNSNPGPGFGRGICGRGMGKRLAFFDTEMSMYNPNHPGFIPEERFEAFKEEMQEALLLMVTIPDRITVNTDKRAVAVVFTISDKDYSFVSKASDNDEFDPELGFLVAYYHKLLGVSKTQTPEVEKVLLNSEVKFLKGFLYSEFMRATDFDYVRAQKYINRKVKKALSIFEAEKAAKITYIARKALKKETENKSK